MKKAIRKLNLQQGYMGDDMMGGWWEDYGAPALGIVATIAAPVIGQRLTPTQKSIVQQVTGTSTSIPPSPPKKTFMEENGPYVIIGGAVLMGVIILAATRKHHV
jgi:hypothetical protein